MYLWNNKVDIIYKDNITAQIIYDWSQEILDIIFICIFTKVK